MPVKCGRITFIGAGPGSPDLLTLRAVEWLRRADAVVADPSVNPVLMNHCRPSARIFWTGRPGCRGVQVRRLLRKLAGRGLTVARLKNGDAFLFGRGADEADDLIARGIPVEMVPGVPSVSAVPVLAGIPLTHPECTSTVTIVAADRTGENTFNGGRRKIRWEKIPPDGTLVILMGLSRLEGIVKGLLKRHWFPRTSVAVVSRGGTAEQRVVRGDLTDIVRKVREEGLTPPAVIVVGETAGLRVKSPLPLRGRTVLVTRPEGQSAGLSKKIASLGAIVMEDAAVEIRPLPFHSQGIRVLRAVPSYDWLIFTSVNGVTCFSEWWRFRTKTDGRDRWPRGPRVCAIGPKTAAEIRRQGGRVDRIAPEYVSQTIAGSLGNIRGKKILIPRALTAPHHLPSDLKKRGARVTVWPLYDTVHLKLSPKRKRDVLGGRVDIVTFTSSSTVHAFVENFSSTERKTVFQKITAASIGPVTTETLSGYGVPRLIQAAEPTAESLAETLGGYYQSRYGN